MINILLVEDNQGFRELLKELFKERSIKANVVDAENPIEALKNFSKYEQDFDYIICDYFLPVQNGNDFLEIVKSHKPGVTCILMSADESLKKKQLPYVDIFFFKEQINELIKYIQNHSLRNF